MSKPLGLAGRCGFTLLAVTIIGLPIGLFCGAMELFSFLAVGSLWLVVSAALIFGHDITEITIWKASIKRDATAAMLAREEVERTRDQLLRVSAVIVENSYITSGEILLLIKTLMGEEYLEKATSSRGMKRLFANMNEIWAFVEPDPIKAEQRRRQLRRELGMVDL